MPEIGTKIKQRRVEKDLTLAELARRVNISKGYLHSMESGDTHSPSAEILFAIANELGTTIADLLDEDEQLLEKPFNISESLLQFANEEQLPQADVEMLARIEYRGKRPESRDDWRFIYESIKRTLR